MATVRKLTIASMKGQVWIRFIDVANQNIVFNSTCGGTISVSRSKNGTTYVVNTDTDHIRVFVDIVGPDDLPHLFYWSGGSTYGWWHLEGYPQTDFASGPPPAFLSKAEGMLDAEVIAQSKDLGEPQEANIWKSI